MTLLFDENLAPRLTVELRDAFPGSKHVHDVGLSRASDAEVWAFARAESLVIVTRDANFHDLSVLRGAPPKVVWIRRGNCSTDDIATMLRRAAFAITAFIDDPNHPLLMLT